MAPPCLLHLSPIFTQSPPEVGGGSCLHTFPPASYNLLPALIRSRSLAPLCGGWGLLPPGGCCRIVASLDVAGLCFPPPPPPLPSGSPLESNSLGFSCWNCVASPLCGTLCSGWALGSCRREQMRLYHRASNMSQFLRDSVCALTISHLQWLVVWPINVTHLINKSDCLLFRYQKRNRGFLVLILLGRAHGHNARHN